MDILEPLQVFYEYDPEHSESDQDRLIQEMVEINTALADWLAGRVDQSFVCDMIAQYGLDVDSWIETAIDNLTYSVESGLINSVSKEEVSALITIPRWSYDLTEALDGKAQI